MGIIHTLAVKPQKKGTLSGITYNLGVLSAPVKFSCGIDCDSLINHISRRVTKEIGLSHLHLIFCQGTGFIGTYDGGGAHGFTGVHLTHQVVGFKHPAHGISQGKSHRHGQTFRHGNHHQGHCKHE